MHQLITDKKKIEELHLKFTNRIVDMSDIDVECKLFVYHDSIDSLALYSYKHKIWASLYNVPVEENRYWNAFGKMLSIPRPGQTLSIIVEINYPIEGSNWTISSFWTQNSLTKQHHLFHQGKIGGGAKGVNQFNFFKFWDKEKFNFNFNSKPIDCVEVCILENPDFSDRIANFINSVRKIKLQIKDPTIKFEKN